MAKSPFPKFRLMPSCNTMLNHQIPLFFVDLFKIIFRVDCFINLFINLLHLFFLCCSRPFQNRNVAFCLLLMYFFKNLGDTFPCERASLFLKLCLLLSDRNGTTLIAHKLFVFAELRYDILVLLV